MWKTTCWQILTLAGGLAICNYCRQEMECGQLAKLKSFVLAKHKPSFTVSLCMTFDLFCFFCNWNAARVILWLSCLLMLLYNMKSCVFHSVSPLMVLWLPCVRDCSGAGVTASHWPYQAAYVGPKPGQSDVRPASSGWTTVRPAATRRAEEWQKHPLLPLTYLPPSALSLSTLQCLFSGRLGFLHDGVVDERRKRGMGLRGKGRHRERWMRLVWQLCAHSNLGSLFWLVFVFSTGTGSCKGEWAMRTEKITL